MSSAKTDFCNIAFAIDEAAQKNPYQGAIYYPEGRNAAGRTLYSHYTYQQLIAMSDQIARGLGEVGITRGMRTALMVTPSLEFFALTFAMFRAGIVPIFIDPGMGRRNLGTCLADAEPEAFIGIPKAHAARVVLGWGKETNRVNVTVGRKGFWGGVTLEEVKRRGASDDPFEVAQTQADDLAAIIFTSGSTGIPKGVAYTHGNFTSQVEMLRLTLNIQPGEIDLPTFPMFALFDAALGMATVIPEMDAAHPAKVDPRKIIEAIEDFGVTNMFGSPALLDRVGRYGVKHNIKLPTVRRVISAGAPAEPDILERFSHMLMDDAEIFTPYGATECLPIASIGSREILGETRHQTDAGKGVCVGLPVEGMRVTVIDINEEPIPEWDDTLSLPQGEIGEIVVKGPQVTELYINRPDSTRQAKISHPDGSILHRMGDVGYFDEQGRLWYAGRKAHRVVTAAGTLFTIMCERVFNLHPLVLRTALVGVNINGETEPLLCIELKDETQQVDRESIKRDLLELGTKHDHTGTIKRMLFHPKFPVDIRHNSKIFREELTVWAQKQVGK